MSKNLTKHPQLVSLLNHIWMHLERIDAVSKDPDITRVGRADTEINLREETVNPLRQNTSPVKCFKRLRLPTNGTHR